MAFIIVEKEGEDGLFLYNDATGVLEERPLKRLKPGKSALRTGQRVLRSFANEDAEFLAELQRQGSILAFTSDSSTGGFLVANKKGEVGQLDPGFLAAAVGGGGPGTTSFALQSDIVGDIADVVGMTPQLAGATIAGVFGGPFAAAAFAGIGELGRQLVGESAGIAQIGTPESQINLAIAPASEFIGPTGAAAIRGIRRVGRAAGGFMQIPGGVPDQPRAGVEGLSLMQEAIGETSVPRLLLPGGRSVPLLPKFLGKFRPLARLEDATLRIETGLNKLKSRGVERDAKALMLKRNGDMVINFSELSDEFLDKVPTGQRDGARKVLREVTADIMERRPDLADLAPIERAERATELADVVVNDDVARKQFFGELNPEEADLVRARIATRGFENPSSLGGRIADEVVSQARQTQREMSEMLKLVLQDESVDVAGEAQTFSQVMDAVSAQENLIGTLGRKFGGRVDPESLARSVSALRRIRSEEMADLQRAILDLDAAFPEDRIAEAADEAFRGQFFTGEFRTPDIQPRVTATGGAQGAAMGERLGLLQGGAQSAMGILPFGTQSGAIRTVGAGQSFGRAVLDPLEAALTPFTRAQSRIGLQAAQRRAAGSLAGDLPPPVDVGDAIRLQRSASAATLNRLAGEGAASGFRETPEQQIARLQRERRAVNLGRMP